MRCTFKTVFYVNGSKERNGIVPIMGRVTINGTIAQFSCKQSVTKAIWDAKGNRAIAHRIKTAGIKRKITNDQVRVIRTMLSGTHEDMMNIAANGQLDDWCNDSYAEAMSKYGLKRGVRGSDARHTTTAQYYRNIKRETERLQNCMKLLQSDIEEAQRLLQQTKSEISTEKLQAAKMEAKTAFVSKIGSLLGSGKLKEVEQHNRKLCELVTNREQYIDELHEKIQRMEDSHSQQLGEMQQIHQAEVVDLKSKHATEVSLLNDIVRKAKHWFPMLEARLQMEDLCRRVGFTVEQIGVLLTGKALNFSGSLYSEEHRRKFNVENAEIKVFSDSTKPNQLFLYINRQPIIEWFKEQWNISKIEEIIIFDYNQICILWQGARNKRARFFSNFSTKSFSN